MISHTAIQPAYYDLDAEQAVLGCLVLDMGENHATPAIFGEMKANDMVRDLHRWAFQVCFDLWERKVPLDIISVGAELAARYPRIEQDEHRKFSMYLGH